MKGVYWRPRTTSRWGLLGIAAAALCGLAAVERNPSCTVGEWRAEKLEAARLAECCMETVRRERLRRGHVLDTRFDPAETGLIGDSMTLVTTVPGNLRAKQTSLNPNYAAAVVEMLHQAGVERGDCVAVGCSGSFPALNISVYAALETLGAKPVIVASATASQFGANLPDLMWVDMERLLYNSGLISFRSAAVSPGGYEDCNRGVSAEIKQLVFDAVARNALEYLPSESLASGIQRRMEVYEREADGAPIKAYINVGGGAASVGRTEGKHRYEPGLNVSPSDYATEIDSVMSRFARLHVPLIHLVEVDQLAARYGFPEAPEIRPAVGTGGVFQRRQYNRWFAAGILVLIMFSLRVVVLSAWPQHARAWAAGLLAKASRPGFPTPQRLPVLDAECMV